MIKEFYICWALLSMNGVINQDVICNNLDVLHQTSEEFKIDSTLYTSMLWEETNFTPDLKSYTGKACGISQVLPQYTDLYNKKVSYKKKKAEKRRVCNLLKDTRVGMYYGAKAFSFWFHKYGRGNKYIALCGYNAGFRCKGESLEMKDMLAAKRANEIYVPKVLKFHVRLNRKIRKLKKRVKSFTGVFKPYFNL